MAFYKSKSRAKRNLKKGQKLIRRRSYIGPKGGTYIILRGKKKYIKVR